LDKEHHRTIRAKTHARGPRRIHQGGELWRGHAVFRAGVLSCGGYRREKEDADCDEEKDGLSAWENVRHGKPSCWSADVGVWKNPRIVGTCGWRQPGIAGRTSVLRRVAAGEFLEVLALGLLRY
jgi:hypothetical protein